MLRVPCVTWHFDARVDCTKKEKRMVLAGCQVATGAMVDVVGGRSSRPGVSSIKVR